MTLTLSLSSDEEQRLLDAARQRGVRTDELAHQILQIGLNQLTAGPKPMSNIVFGLHAGQGWIADDFDAPLPDSFWHGEE